MIAVLAGCQGTIGDQGDPVEPILPPIGADDLSNGRIRTRLWRLTPIQFETEARRLLGDLPDAGQYPLGEPQDGFTNFAAGATIDRSVAQRIAQITEDYAAWAEDNAADITGCGADFGSAACTDGFIADFLTRAYRRPSTPEEQNTLRALYDSIEAEHGASYAFRSIVQAVLMSPHVLYRSELGAPFDGDTVAEPAEGEEIVVLSDYEIASLLAFALTDESPDAALLEAAAAGRLRDPAERRMQALRLMGRSQVIWRRFFWEWLDMDRFDPQADAIGLSDTLRSAMLEEYAEFVGRIVVDERGTLDDLFSASRSWASPELAELYGVDHPGSGLAPINFNPSERSGLLTQGAWLVSHGSREEEYVVRRGMGIYLHALCRDLTPPEGLDVNAAQSELAPRDAPIREQVEARSNADVCGACHQVPDPIGLAFERYGADARIRDAYPDGHPIDSSTVVPLIGQVDSAADLGAQLAASEDFQTCFVRRFAHSILGTDLGRNSGWVNDVTDSFLDEGRSIEAMVLHLSLIHI